MIVKGVVLVLVLFAKISPLFPRLVVLRGLVNVHRYYYDDRRLLCVSEDDGGGLIWNGNLNWNYDSYAFSDRGGQIDFHPVNTHAKSILDCEMNAYKPCMTSWNITNWALTNSIAEPMGPVFDRRWEDFREFSNFHGYNEYRRVDTLQKTSTMIFSIRGTLDAHILLCDSEQYEHDFCYWIIIGGWNNTKSVLRVCPQGVPYPTIYPNEKSECGIARATHTHSPLSPTEWRTFVLMWNFTTGNITLYDPDNIILTFSDLGTASNRSSNNYHVFLRSTMPILFRSHTYSFLYTTDYTASLISPRLNLNSHNLCLQILLGLCSECQIEIILVDPMDEEIEEVLDTIDGSKATVAHRLPMWQYVKISKTVSFHTEDGVKIKLLPKINGKSIRPLWAIAEIRVCPPSNAVRYGIMDATQDYYDEDYHWPNVTCQKIFYNESTVVSSIMEPTEGLEFEDLYCPEGKTGLHCTISCLNHLTNDADCRGSVICEGSGCTCSPGFIGKDCRSNCNIGQYGHGCKETCGWCRNQNCNFKTGVCISGCDNSKRYNIPPFCKAGIDTLPPPEIDFVNETTARVTVVVKEEYKKVSVEYVFKIRQEDDNIEKPLGEPRKVLKNDSFLVGHVDDLSPGTSYLIKCVLHAENNYVKIDGSWKNFTTRCASTTEFEATANETSILLKMLQDPKTLYACPEAWYDFSFNNLDENLEIYKGSLVKLPFTFFNLKPFTLFKLTISKRNATLFSKEIRTLEGAPSQVRNLQKILSAQEVTLSWDPPADPNGNLTKYEVILQLETFLGCKDLKIAGKKNITFVESTRSTNISFSDLHFYARYVAKVTAYTSKRGVETSIDFSTKETEIPNVALSNLRIQNFTLYWDPPIDCTSISGPIPATRIQIDGISDSVKYYHDTKQTKNNYLKLDSGNIGIHGAETYKARIYALRGYHKLHNETQYTELIFTTPPTSPPQVRNLEIFETDFKTRRTSLRWQRPQLPLNGEIQHYIISNCISSCTLVQKILPSETCLLWKDYICSTIELPENQFETIAVAAVNANVTVPGKSSSVSINRHQIEPEAPRDFTVAVLDRGIVNISWSHPWKSNGHLSKFFIAVEMLTTNLREDIPISEAKKTFEYTLENYEKYYQQQLYLLTSSTYKISLRGVTNTEIQGEVKERKIVTPLAIAFKGELTSEVDNDDSTIILHIPVIVNDTKNSLTSVIVKGPNPCEKYSQLGNDLRDRIGIEKHEIAWIAGKFPTKEYSGKIFVVGDNRLYNGVTNCPLKPEESYEIVVIVQTDGGSMNGQIMRAKTTLIRIGELPKTHDAAWLVPSLIFLLIAVTLFYFYRRKRQDLMKNIILQEEMALDHGSENCETKSGTSESKQTLVGSSSSGKDSLPRISTPEVPLLVAANSDCEIEERSAPVKVKDFEDYVKNAIASGLLEKQYETFPRGQTKPWEYGKIAQNKAKNRYGNLIAYDETRVVLKKLPDDPYSDYINANYIKGYKKDRCYIATQGPKPTTVIDFWRMIWQEEVLIICMLANITENGKVKCKQYWPDIGKKKKYGDVIVLNAKHNVFADYTLRTLHISCGDETRKIEHLHYTAWPDHGVPLYTHSVVTYLKKLLATPPGDGPIVVHCSAGVGRTGTIILCHICLQQAAAEGVIDVFAKTEAIRSQRANMVDNKQQYLLAHLAIAEYLLSFPTTLPCNEALTVKIKELKKQLPLQMQRLESTRWQDEALRPSFMQTTLSDRNVAKNRFPELISARVNRIYLKRYPATDQDSDYISAVFVDGVRLQKQYLAAQLPLPSTFNDFWRMIAEFKVELIITLQPPDPGDPTCCPIVPSNEFKPTPYINVTSKDSTTLETYTLRKLSLLDNSEKPTREQQITILCLHGWEPGRNKNPPEVMSMVTLWQAAERIPRGEGPVVIMCHDGVTGCGLYLALSFLLERMTVERECDVCLAIRAIRRSRPDFVESVKHMEYLYDAATTYLEYFETYANFT